MAERTTNEPAYRKVAADLRSKVSSGTYPVGADLPSLPDLMAQYRETVGVIRRAIVDLRIEGIVETSQGRPTKVVALPRQGSTDLEEIKALLGGLRQDFRTLDERVTELERRKAHSPVRQRATRAPKQSRPDPQSAP